MMKRIAIFASGSGTNAEKIICHFNANPEIEVAAILSNNSNAFVLSRAKKLSIPAMSFSRSDFYESDKIVTYLEKKEINFIVLSGFLWLLPMNLLQRFANSIVNIHPALLPKYGGKGMYGMNVHRAVVGNRETETGITIHMVNEKYDEGEIIFQAKCSVLPTDTPEQVAEKVHQLEYKYFSKIIERLL